MESVQDATERLHSALHGKNKDEVSLDIVTTNSLERRLEIAKKYEELYKKELYEDIKDKLSGHFKELVGYLFLSPMQYNAKQLKRAFRGLSIDEVLVFEILVGKSLDEYEQIKQAYQAETKKDLVKAIEKGFSGPMRAAVLNLISTPRRVNPTPDKGMCENLADALISKGENNWISDENLFKQVFLEASPEELVMISRFYYKKTGNVIIDVIEKKLSGKNKALLKEIVYDVINPQELFAEKIYLSIKGLGTDTAVLNRVLASRSQIDMPEIREIYQNKYNVTMRQDIIGDTSGTYQKLCLYISEL